MSTFKIVMTKLSVFFRIFFLLVVEIEICPKMLFGHNCPRVAIVIWQNKVQCPGVPPFASGKHGIQPRLA